MEKEQEIVRKAKRVVRRSAKEQFSFRRRLQRALWIDDYEWNGVALDEFPLLYKGSPMPVRMIAKGYNEAAVWDKDDPWYKRRFHTVDGTLMMNTIHAVCDIDTGMVECDNLWAAKAEIVRALLKDCAEWNNKRERRAGEFSPMAQKERDAFRIILNRLSKDCETYDAQATVTGKEAWTWD